MHIIVTERFKKRFEKLPTKIQKQFEKRLDLFIKNPTHPLLKNHPLSGNLIGLRAISITGDYRVIFRIIDLNTAKFIDIGTHSQVY